VPHEALPRYRPWGLDDPLPVPRWWTNRAIWQRAVVIFHGPMPDEPQTFIHRDFHPGNVLWTDDGPHFVDFDDARMGPAVQDLWMLLSGDRAAMTRQLSDVLAGYEDFFDFDRRELHLLEALRTLRMIHYSAWLARRWNDPAFPAAFPWFHTTKYWQDQILQLREQVAAMQDSPLGPL